MMNKVTLPIDLEAFAVITSGGGPLGMHHCNPAPSPSQVTCPKCGRTYGMAVDPLAFAFSPTGVTVLPGYVERCAWVDCRALHEAGAVLETKL